MIAAAAKVCLARPDPNPLRRCERIHAGQCHFLAGLSAIGLIALSCAVVAATAAEPRPAPRRGSAQPVQAFNWADVPTHAFDVILSRPTSNSITASVLCYEDTEGHIAYGPRPGELLNRTPTRSFKKGEPAEILLSGLLPDSRYFYQLRLTRANSAERSFHTARAAGNGFTFTITADSHLDENTEPGVYRRTLAQALADAPDFHIDLGDTFMTEKHQGRESALKQYLAQRYYFGQLCHSSTLFLVLGNHDGESPRGRGSESDSLAVWSNLTRKRYFPNPVPDAFYSGNATEHPEAGLLQDYYAWTWGDALFVVLDPYWFTHRLGTGKDLWSRSLGADQYQWLKRTLEMSKAPYKFIFIHHLVGGADSQNRGGAEAAPFYEWGGKNHDGTDGFVQHRPGWAAPIHRLLVQNQVQVVFHGHDHFYARQELDGVCYQLVPQPGHPDSGRPPRSAAAYGYATGKLLGSSGHLRVIVRSDRATVDYIGDNRSVLDSAALEPAR